MIVITGAAGFIGSCLTAYLNEQGHSDLVLVDDFSRADKQKNEQGKQFFTKVHRWQFFDWLSANATKVRAVFHLGARTDTTATDWGVFEQLNLGYTQKVWLLCSQYQIPLVYASSAATYGLGEHGYVDSHAVVDRLVPLNLYGKSKNDFDKWALAQRVQPPYWYGLKFFNVYGPNEYHKGRMASVIFHAFRQIQATGRVRLFRSHHNDYHDGEQCRDFIYVKDVVSFCDWLITTKPTSGLYNVGTGKARTFLALAEAIFTTLDRQPLIDFIDTPLDIRDKYQYFTQADRQKVLQIAYNAPLYSLEAGVADYVGQYLLHNNYY